METQAFLVGVHQRRSPAIGKRSLGCSPVSASIAATSITVGRFGREQPYRLNVRVERDDTSGQVEFLDIAIVQVVFGKVDG